MLWKIKSWKRDSWLLSLSLHSLLMHQCMGLSSIFREQGEGAGHLSGKLFTCFSVQGMPNWCVRDTDTKLKWLALSCKKPGNKFLMLGRTQTLLGPLSSAFGAWKHSQMNECGCFNKTLLTWLYVWENLSTFVGLCMCRPQVNLRNHSLEVIWYFETILPQWLGAWGLGSSIWSENFRNLLICTSTEPHCKSVPLCLASFLNWGLQASMANILPTELSPWASTKLT